MQVHYSYEHVICEHHASCVRRCSIVLCAYLVLFLAKSADLYDSVSLLLGGVAVPVLGTRVFKSKEPIGSNRVDEALVVGTLLLFISH